MNENMSHYRALLAQDYAGALEILKARHGLAVHAYFSPVSYSNLMAGKTKSISIQAKASRGKEGLYCHHDHEDALTNISNGDFCKAQGVPYDRHAPEFLTYCDLWEHIILHVHIVRETKAKHGAGGLVNYLLPIAFEWYGHAPYPPTSRFVAHYERARVNIEEYKALTGEIAEKLRL